MRDAANTNFSLNARLTCEWNVSLFDPVMDRLLSNGFDRSYFTREFGRVRTAVLLADPNDLGPRLGFLVFEVYAHAADLASLCGMIMERVAGIEPASQAWEANVITTIRYPRVTTNTPQPIQAQAYPATHHSSKHRPSSLVLAGSGWQTHVQFPRSMISANGPHWIGMNWP